MLQIHIFTPEQPLKGRAGSQLVVGLTQLSHARLSWRVLQNLVFYYGDLTRATIKAGRSDELYKIQVVGGWELARARGLERAYAVARGGGAR
eukprot:1985252-Pleurochrysis_carterae.AAC.1